MRYNLDTTNAQSIVYLLIHTYSSVITTPNRDPFVSLPIQSLLPAPGGHRFVVHYGLNLCFLEFHINGIMWNIVFILYMTIFSEQNISEVHPCCGVFYLPSLLLTYIWAVSSSQLL